MNDALPCNHATGGVLGILNYEVNLLRLSNAVSLWLGIQPPDIFFYAFLPPLLVDAALRLDWYIFKKARRAALPGPALWGCTLAPRAPSLSPRASPAAPPLTIPSLPPPAIPPRSCTSTSCSWPMAWSLSTLPPWPLSSCLCWGLAGAGGTGSTAPCWPPCLRPPMPWQ